MADEFFVTNKGIELITQAIKDESKVDITKVKFGDGGISGEKDYDITALKNEVYSKSFDPLTDSYKIDEKDGKSFVITTLYPAEEEGTINEIGYFDSSDNLIIYGTVRQIEKIAGVPHSYINWVKFDNIEDTAVEITIISPEYEKVDNLVEETKEEFTRQLEEAQSTVTQIVERAEQDFDLSNYVKLADLQGVDIKDLSSKVTKLETSVGETDVSQLKTKVDSINDNVTSIQGQVTQMETDIDNCVTQEQFKKVEENSNKVWHLDPDNPTCQLSELSSKAESANFGDMYIVSDDNNHAYVFLGKNVSGTVNDGFYDIGGHVDLTNYVTEGEHNTLNERVQQIEEKINVIEPMLTGLDTALEELIGTA